MRELSELDLLCSVVGDSGGTGRFWANSRLHASLASFEVTGDLSAFHEDLRSARAFVEHLHSLDR